MNTIPKFFEHDDYIVNEKVAVLKLTNSYAISDITGNAIGRVRQNMSGGYKVLSLLINKSMMPFHFDILDGSEQVVASITRGWTFWMSKITVAVYGQEVARINQRFSVLKPRFTITGADGQEIGQISGNWRAWNFTITGRNGQEIGTIDKQWNGAMKEVFTTADKYHVKIDKTVEEDIQKVAIAAAAITVDMVLKESN